MKIICLLKRKTGLSLQEFRDYYEHVHAPLALELMPYFKSYQRNYVGGGEYNPGHLENKRVVLEFDVVTEISFKDRSDYEKMLKALADQHVGKQIADDEDKFLDRKSMVMFFVDEVNSDCSDLN